MNTLSLFNGGSFGRMALDIARVPVTNYYSSEIDKHADKFSRAIFSDNIDLGDITQLKNIDWTQQKIDLVIGGSPCQGFSFAGKQLNFDDPRSALFFEYVSVLNEIRLVNPDVKFLLENVKMKKESKDVISKYLGVEPEELNSNKWSAQNRKRLYWTNIKYEKEKVDDKIFLKDILEENISKELSEDRVKSLLKFLPKNFKTEGKSPTLTTELADGSGKNLAPKLISEIYNITGKYRMPTVRECGRLQTVPENILDKILNSGVSDTQILKIFGNGWTVSVIAHIFQGLKTPEFNNLDF